MSRRNREKRAAKQKARRRPVPEREQRAAAGPESGPTFVFDTGPDRAQRQARLTEALRGAAICGCADVGRHADEFVAATPGPELEAAADLAVAQMVRGAWEAGWTPLDVVELGRRRLDPPVQVYLAETIVDESRRYSPAMVHPRWREAVATIAAAHPDERAAGTSHLREHATSHGLSRAVALVVALRALGLLCSLPRMERMLPLPGESRHRVAQPAAAEVDQKALSRVRALLAKAESTEFPDEAEALSAKAQELMSRYALHQAVLDHDSGHEQVAGGRRLWLDAPYIDAKAVLVQEVGSANRVRMVWSSGFGFATILGADADLDSVELLVTSLLVQANRAMLAAGRQTTRSGTSRTRSFRQSFLVAYASRIGERLSAATSTATAEVDAEIGTRAEVAADSRLLPVLAARSQAVDELIERLFPTVVQRGVSVSNHAGWSAGRAAADLAQLGVRGSIAG